MVYDLVTMLYPLLAAEVTASLITEEVYVVCTYLLNSTMSRGYTHDPRIFSTCSGTGLFSSMDTRYMDLVWYSL